MYAEEIVVAQDYIEAVRWFRKAAEQGHMEAQYNLGLLYENGTGVANPSQAVILKAHSNTVITPYLKGINTILRFYDLLH
jgi:TPR repeat protein